VKAIMRMKSCLSVVMFGSVFLLVGAIVSVLIPDKSSVQLSFWHRAATSSMNQKRAVMEQPEIRYTVNETGNEIKEPSQTTPHFLADSQSSSTNSQPFGIETEEDSVALKVLKATCSFCGNVIDHLKRHGVPTATFGELVALEKSEGYKFRVVISVYCPDCMDAIAYAEDNMYGRLLSVDEMRGMLDSSTFSQVKEAACVAGYVPPRSRVAWAYLPACDVGNSVDIKI